MLELKPNQSKANRGQTRFYVWALCSPLILFGLAACTELAETPPYEYATTSTRGDYSEWVMSGNQLDVTWEVIDSAGLTAYTFDISATCSAPASTGLQNCVFDTVSCADGVDMCPLPPTGSFDVMVVPSVALFAHDGDQLHVGFVKDEGTCTDDVSGDYTYARLGLGQRDIFGLYRSDADFLTVSHIDYGFSTTNMNTSQSLSYNSGTPTEVFVDEGCSDGVRYRGNGSTNVRSMMTANGLFVLDLPSGQGGILAFQASNAASLSDFANKSFGGLSFPDNSAEQPLSAEFAGITEDSIEITVNLGGSMQSHRLMNLDTPDTTAAPAFPDFTAVVTGAAANPLQATYNTPNDIPGLFKIEHIMGGDAGRVVMAAVKLNDKVIAFGANYNYRDTSDINPSTGLLFTSPGLYNTGSFLIFEK
jgi:hypothetical protein